MEHWRKDASQIQDGVVIHSVIVPLLLLISELPRESRAYCLRLLSCFAFRLFCCFWYQPDIIILTSTRNQAIHAVASYCNIFNDDIIESHEQCLSVAHLT